VNRGPCNVIMVPCNVNRGLWIVNSGRGMRIGELQYDYETVVCKHETVVRDYGTVECE
jgi:hypothetical protein